MNFIRFPSWIFVFLAIAWPLFFEIGTTVDGHPTPPSDYVYSESEDLSNDDTEATNHSKATDHSERRVVKVLDVQLDSDDYTPQELNLDDLKDHPNYQEIKNLDKASLRAITMLARKKRRAKRETLVKTMRFDSSAEDDVPVPLKDNGI